MCLIDLSSRASLPLEGQPCLIEWQKLPPFFRPYLMVPASPHQTKGISPPPALCSYFPLIYIRFDSAPCWRVCLLSHINSKPPKGRSQIIFILLLSIGPTQVPGPW